MHRIISAITEVNHAMGGPELDAPGARLAFLVAAANMSRVLPASDLRILAEALPLGPALLLLRPFDEDRGQCTAVAAFHVHVVCRVLAAFVKGELALRMREDVPARLCRELRTVGVEPVAPRRTNRPIPMNIPMPYSLRPTVRVPPPVRRRSTLRVRAA